MQKGNQVSPTWARSVIGIRGENMLDELEFARSKHKNIRLKLGLVTVISLFFLGLSMTF